MLYRLMRKCFLSSNRIIGELKSGIQVSLWGMSILLLVFVQGCSGSSASSMRGSNGGFITLKKDSLPNIPGVYFLEGRELVKIPSNQGNEIDFENAPHFQGDLPQFVVYLDDATPDNFYLFNHLGFTNPIIVKEIEDSTGNFSRSLLQIRISEPLEDGYYCFSQDKLVNPAIIHSNSTMNWCFLNGSPMRLGGDTDYLDITLPADLFGFYFYSEDGVAYITPSSLEDEIDTTALPIVNQLSPTILFQSDTHNPERVQLFWRHGIVGIGFSLFNDEPIVNSVAQYSPAESVGIQPGDMIVGVNGIDVTGWDLMEVRNLIRSACTPNGKIDVEILRGTQRNLAQPACVLDIGDQIEGLSYLMIPGRSFAEFQIKYPLYPNNIYCLYIQGTQEKSCFRVK